MLSKEMIQQQIASTLQETDFEGLGERIRGKVRDIYVGDDTILLIATDRQSAFDRILAHVPFKGQVLTQASVFWFEHTKDIVPNHLLSVPDPNVVACKKLRVFPVEVVVRGYITGVTDTAAWTAYARGEREFCGNTLPEGLRKNQKFAQPILTPTTKAEDHDEKISAREIVERGLMTQEQWDYVAGKALELFERGTRISEEHGVILVDTKYEFGYDDAGKIYLIDEIHTPDSSRYWLKATYAERFANRQEPDSIDKEFLRLWFVEHCDPYHDDELPPAPEELVVELSRRYIQSFEMITGKTFEAEVGDVAKRIEQHLKSDSSLSGK
jgi:phosphoribosylaminoimidazole-succinocarboxamide synthase